MSNPRSASGSSPTEHGAPTTPFGSTQARPNGMSSLGTTCGAASPSGRPHAGSQRPDRAGVLGRRSLPSVGGSRFDRAERRSRRSGSRSEQKRSDNCPSTPPFDAQLLSAMTNGPIAGASDSDRPGVAGLLAARVLEDRYVEVMIVHRDRLPDDSRPPGRRPSRRSRPRTPCAGPAAPQAALRRLHRAARRRRRDRGRCFGQRADAPHRVPPAIDTHRV